MPDGNNKDGYDARPYFVAWGGGNDAARGAGGLGGGGALEGLPDLFGG